MSDPGFTHSQVSIRRPWGGVVLFGLAALTFYFFSSEIVPAFRGPRSITTEELLAIPEPKSDRYREYVEYAARQEASETGLAVFLSYDRLNPRRNSTPTDCEIMLLPVGDRFLICQIRSGDRSTRLVGHLEGGKLHHQAKRWLEHDNPALKGRLLPVTLETTGNVWIIPTIALLLVAMFAFFGVRSLIKFRRS